MLPSEPQRDGRPMFRDGLLSQKKCLGMAMKKTAHIHLQILPRHTKFGQWTSHWWEIEKGIYSPNVIMNHNNPSNVNNVVSTSYNFSKLEPDEK